MFTLGNCSAMASSTPDELKRRLFSKHAQPAERIASFEPDELNRLALIAMTTPDVRKLPGRELLRSAPDI